MNKNETKELIREYESARTGIELLNDQNISVLNVRVNKRTIRADVIYWDYSEGTSKRCDHQLYPIDLLEQFHKTRVLPTA